LWWFQLSVPNAGLYHGNDDRHPELRVLVAAGYPAVRTGLATMLANDPAIAVQQQMPADLAVAADLFDAIVIDVPSSGPERIDALVDAHLNAALVLIGGEPSTDGPGLMAGPVAYLTPDVDAATLVAAVHAVARGLTVIDPELIHIDAAPHPGPPSEYGDLLTAREREVLELVASGLPNKTIARELGISEHTAKFHVGSLLSKLGAASRTEAVTIATRRGLLSV
jgi:DNA-binding NarL/FixJ family response regulator